MTERAELHPATASALERLEQIHGWPVGFRTEALNRLAHGLVALDERSDDDE